MVTIRPMSSTTIGTVRPANPRASTITVTTIEVPASAFSGTSARLACTSASISSSPNPTVKTGTDAARRGSSASPRAASVLSPPSETTTMPERGTPCSSLRA